MDINLVLDEHNSGWILGKMARRLRENFTELGHDATVMTEPRRDADVNHFMNYNLVRRTNGICSAMITHLDDYYKLRHVRRLLRRDVLDYAICMSPHMAQGLAQAGCDPARVRWCLPAVDEMPPLRRIRIGLSGRVHEDGRKNEAWLIEAARSTDMRPFAFHFFGRGWQSVADALEFAGAQTAIAEETADFRSDYAVIVRSLPTTDYWMYLGFDEGAMGVLDAALAGVRLIVTPQGYHLNLPNGIYRPVSSVEQLSEALTEIGRPLVNLLDTADAWTWRRYALEHLSIWEGTDGGRLGVQPHMNVQRSILGISRRSMMRRSLSPRRIRSAVARSAVGRRVRTTMFANRALPPM